MISGYWITLCFDIQTVWNYCYPGSDEYKKIKEHGYVPNYSEAAVEATQDADEKCNKVKEQAKKDCPDDDKNEDCAISK